MLGLRCGSNTLLAVSCLNILQPLAKPLASLHPTLTAHVSLPPSPPHSHPPAGEGFVRASAFGHRDNILEAVERFKKVYGGNK